MLVRKSRVDFTSVRCVTVLAIALLGAGAFVAGCKNDDGDPPDTNPQQTAKAEAARIDQAIEKYKNDPSIPAESKQKIIEGMERGKAAAAAAAAASQQSKPK